MPGSIVCGVGGSESARHAVRLARGLGSELGLRLVFVRVVEPGSHEEEVSAVAERLSLLSECTTDVDRGAGWLVDVGHPAECLAAVAVDEEARFTWSAGAGLTRRRSAASRSSSRGEHRVRWSSSRPAPRREWPTTATTTISLVQLT